uniref:Cystatin domain-containing protein n=1 Tax=Amphimedon queenslandica TaxID=400682 RepID=A0A1X7T1T4_AMPQE
VKVFVEKQSGRKFTEFKAISFRSQVVEGVNYIIKVCVGDGQNDYIMLRVHENLDGGVTLLAYQLDKTKDDPILINF